MEEIVKEYNEFRKDIVEKDWKLDKEQVMKELSDFSYLIDNLPRLYSHITWGTISKVMTDVDTIMNIYDEKMEDERNDMLNLFMFDLIRIKLKNWMCDWSDIKEVFADYSVYEETNDHIKFSDLWKQE